MKYLGGVIGALMSGFLYDVNPKYPFVMASVAFAVATVLAMISATKKEPVRS